MSVSATEALGRSVSRTGRSHPDEQNDTTLCCLDSDLSSTIFWLCDRELRHHPLSAAVSSSVQRGVLVRGTPAAVADRPPHPGAELSRGEFPVYEKSKVDASDRGLVCSKGTETSSCCREAPPHAARGLQDEGFVAGGGTGGLGGPAPLPTPHRQAGYPTSPSPRLELRASTVNSAHGAAAGAGSGGIFLPGLWRGSCTWNMGSPRISCLLLLAPPPGVSRHVCPLGLGSPPEAHATRWQSQQGPW